MNNVPWPCRDYCGACEHCTPAIDLELELYLVQQTLIAGASALQGAGQQGAPHYVLAEITRDIRRNVREYGRRVDALTGHPPHLRDAEIADFYKEIGQVSKRYRFNFRVSEHDAEDALNDAVVRVLLKLKAREVLGASAITVAPHVFPSPQIALKARFNHASPFWPQALTILYRLFVDLTREPPRSPIPDQLVSKDSPVEDQAYVLSLEERTLPGLMRWIAKLPGRPQDFMRYMLARPPARERAIHVDQKLALNLGIGALPVLRDDKAVADALGITPHNLQEVRGKVLRWALGLPWALRRIADLTDAAALSAEGNARPRDVLAYIAWVADLSLDDLDQHFTATMAWCTTLSGPERDWVRHALATLPDPWPGARERDKKHHLGLDLPAVPDPILVDRFRTDVRSLRSRLRAASEDLYPALVWVMDL